MKKSIRTGGQIFGLFVALAAAGTASATTPGSVCREQTVFNTRSSIKVFAGDDSYLYLGLSNGKLQRVAKSDFTENDLDSAGAAITQMTLDANTIYFATTATENMALHHQIFAISKLGGSPLMIADVTENIGSMTNDTGFVYWIVPSSSPTAADGKIERVSKTGGQIHTIISNLAIPNALAVDATNVYFTEEGIGQLPPYGLSKVPTGGGNAIHLDTSKAGEGIAGVANGTVYFEAREDIHNEGIYSIPVTGGQPTPIHTPLFNSSEILRIADGRFIYSVAYFDWTLGNLGGLTVFDTSGRANALSTIQQISSFSVDQTAIYALDGLGSGGQIERYCMNYATAPHVSNVSAGASVEGGSPLTITGLNFQTGAQVTFAGIQGVVESVTPTSIRVIAPAHAAGIFDLYVVNPDGESGRSQIYFDPLLHALRKRAVDRH